MEHKIRVMSTTASINHDEHLDEVESLKSSMRTNYKDAYLISKKKKSYSSRDVPSVETISVVSYVPLHE